MWDLINENSRILLLLEHFGLDFTVGERSVAQLCKENHIPVELFVTLANLYNGFYPDKQVIFGVEEIPDILRFLTNSHIYYKEDKYPEITGYIGELLRKTGDKRVSLIEEFFRSYFDEVVEHLDYEDRIAFPYFNSLADKSIERDEDVFSAREYSLHHTDIETKLTDLKNLLIKHIKLSNELTLRRKLLFALQELEYDLLIHAQIEDAILLPLANKIEKEWKSTR
jgi:regulator of cell morphogenesis and NO signaling